MHLRTLLEFELFAITAYSCLSGKGRTCKLTVEPMITEYRSLKMQFKLFIFCCA